MKKKIKKKKFVDIDKYKNNLLEEKQNNNTFSKDDEDDKNDLDNKKIKQKNKDKDFKSALDKLKFYFPNFSSDFVEEYYEENNNNYSKTKELLTKLSIDERIENNSNQIINKNENFVGGKNNNDKKHNINKNKNEDINKDNNKNNYVDITYLAKFQIADNNEYIENKLEERDNKNKEIIKEENENEGCGSLNDIKDKSKNEYYYINDKTNYNDCFKNSIPKDEIIIDDYLFQQNIEFLCECFPLQSREVIIQKICDSNFDIDEVASSLLKEMNINNIQQNEEDLVNLDITDKDEILSNFLSFENGKQCDFEYDLFQGNLVQKEIEEIIKKENNRKQKNLNQNKNIENEVNLNNINKDEKEEYFLNKKIDDITTQKIKEDLKKLVKHFPLIDEFKIKLVYYQYNNYQLTYKYFDEKYNTKKIGLKSILNDKNKSDFTYPKNNEIKKYNNKNKKLINKFEFSEKQLEIFKKIIDKKPINWKLEEDKNYNLNDYMAVRKKLIFEAKNAYSNQKYKNGQILMAKAKRYKQEIDKIYKNQKIKQFAQNNENRNINEIDLHGLNLEESKYIISKKIQSLKIKKEEQELKNISLSIITGTGSHSIGHKSVLYPNLLDWLKNREKLSVIGEFSKGRIFVTIY